MSRDDLKNKALILYKRVNRDLNRNISPSKCNGHIEDLDNLKDDLYDSGYDWIDDYSEIETVDEEGFFSDDADEDEIQDALEEVEGQLDRLLGRLGVDITEPESGPNQTPITVNISPTMTQNVEASASANVNIQMQIDKLVKEFDEESNRIIPDKNKLQKIIDKLKTLGPIAAPVAQKLAERLSEMFFI